MPEPSSLLMRELLSWISRRPRTYVETLEAWRSSCPRHTVWEDAVIDGLVRIEGGAGEVSLTSRGRERLGEGAGGGAVG